MSVDKLFRLFATLINTALFAFVLSLKTNRFLFQGPSTKALTIAFLSVVYFIFFYLAILDQRKKVKVYTPLISEEDKVQFEIQDVLLAISQCGIEEELKYELKARLDNSVKLFGKEEALKNLVAQHKICTENERFYEQVAWQIGSFFVPVSLTLSALSQTQQVLQRNLAVVGGCVLLCTWVFLFGRFRTTIRLYRDCARLIEEILGFFAVTYVYDYCFEKYGRVVRVWPFLVSLCGFYFNYMIYVVL